MQLLTDRRNSSGLNAVYSTTTSNSPPSATKTYVSIENDISIANSDRAQHQQRRQQHLQFYISFAVILQRFCCPGSVKYKAR